VLKSLMEWAGTRSLVIVTHRPQVFAIVNRIIVLDAGRIMLDAPKDAALQILAKGIVVPPRQSANIDNAVPSAALATPVQN